MSSLSGWYYDLYQNIMDPTEDDPEFTGINRLTTISLHANSKYVSKDNWAYSEIANLRDRKDHQRGRDKQIGEMYDEDGYFYKPICTAVLQEDFQVTVQNQWSDMGDDKLGGFINSLRANLAPFAGTVSAGLFRMAGDQKTVEEQMTEDEKNSISGQVILSLMWMAKKANEVVNGENGENNGNTGEGRAAKYLNSALLINGSRFSIYQGSNLNFNNMGMRFTVIPKWNPETGTFITVNKQLRDMYMYFFGEFLQMDDILKRDDTDEDKQLIKKSATDASGTDKSELLSRITWQRPPGGYQADMSQLDAIQKGSLKLKIGGLYTICNVVVESASLTFSKQMVKNPRATFDNLMSDGKTDIGASDYLSPLSCDVNLLLRPCTRYSDQTFKSIIEGAGMQKEKEDLSEILLGNLKHEISHNVTYIANPEEDYKLKSLYNPISKEEAERALANKRSTEAVERAEAASDEYRRQQIKNIPTDIEVALEEEDIASQNEDVERILRDIYAQDANFEERSYDVLAERGYSHEFIKKIGENTH